MIFTIVINSEISTFHLPVSAKLTKKDLDEKYITEGELLLRSDIEYDLDIIAREKNIESKTESEQLLRSKRNF